MFTLGHISYPCLLFISDNVSPSLKIEFINFHWKSGCLFIFDVGNTNMDVAVRFRAFLLNLLKLALYIALINLFIPLCIWFLLKLLFRYGYAHIFYFLDNFYLARILPLVILIFFFKDISTIHGKHSLNPWLYVTVVCCMFQYFQFLFLKDAHI